MTQETPEAARMRLQHDIDMLRRDHESFAKQADRDITDLNTEVEKVRRDVRENYVSRVEWAPIQKTVWGAVWLVLTSVIGAALTFLLRKG